MSVGDLEGSVANAVSQFLASALAQMGLSGEMLVRAYRQLESFVIGTTAFDFAGAPEHLRSRLTRLEQARLPDFPEHLDGTAAVEAINEAAFEASLAVLLDSLLLAGSTE